MATGNALTRPNQLTDELHEHLQAVIIDSQTGDQDATEWLKKFYPGHDLHIDRLWSQLSPDAQLAAYADYCDGLKRRWAAAQAKAATLAAQLHRQTHSHLADDWIAKRQADDLAAHEAKQDAARLQAEKDSANRERMAQAENARHEAAAHTRRMFGR